VARYFNIADFHWATDAPEVMECGRRSVARVPRLLLELAYFCLGSNCIIRCGFSSAHCSLTRIIQSGHSIRIIIVDPDRTSEHLERLALSLVFICSVW